MEPSSLNLARRAGLESVPVWHSSAWLSGAATMKAVERNDATALMKSLTNKALNSGCLRFFNFRTIHAAQRELHNYRRPAAQDRLSDRRRGGHDLRKLHARQHAGPRTDRTGA